MRSCYLSNYIPLANLEAVVFPSILVSVNSPAVLGYLIPLLQCATRLLTLKLLRLRLEQWRHPVLAAERTPLHHAQKHPLNTTVFFFFFIKCTFSRWTFQNTMKLWKLWSECNRKMFWLFLNSRSIYSLKVMISISRNLKPTHLAVNLLRKRPFC